MELHQDQQFNDSNDVYVWVFDPTPFHKQLIGALIGELSLLQLSVYFSEYFHIHMEYEKIAKILKAKEKKNWFQWYFNESCDCKKTCDVVIILLPRN